MLQLGPPSRRGRFRQPQQSPPFRSRCRARGVFTPPLPSRRSRPGMLLAVLFPLLLLSLLPPLLGGLVAVSL